VQQNSVQKDKLLLVVHVENDSSLKHDTIFTYPSFRSPFAKPPPPPEIIHIPLTTTLRLSTTARPYSQSSHHHLTQPAPT